MTSPNEPREILQELNGDNEREEDTARTETDSSMQCNVGTNCDPNMQCGIGSFRPECLQPWARIQAFVGFFGINGLLTQSLGMYINSQVSVLGRHFVYSAAPRKVSTLERQFGFSSAQTGLLMSCNDIGYLTCIVFAGYIARKIHIPRGLAATTVLYGFSGILCALPFFIQDNSVYDISEAIAETDVNSTDALRYAAHVPLCDTTRNTSAISVSASCSDETSGDRQELWIKKMSFSLIAVGMVFQGAGKCPRLPFVSLYIDDAVDKHKTGFYMGIIAMTGIFGPVLAYVFGGLFSKMYVTLKDVPITPTDPRWIGAWWLGFLMFGSISIIMGIPLACFPRKIKDGVRKLDIDTTEKRLVSARKKSAKSAVVHEVKGFVSSVARVLKNPIYIIIILSNCVNMIGTGGIISFMPKYLVSQYSIPVWQGNIILAGSNIAAVSFGSFIGGVMTRKLDMTPFLTCKLLIIFYIINILTLISGFFLGCDQPELVGGSGNSVTPALYTALNDTCTTGCQCQDEAYFPICADDGRSFFSPCHAGCTSTNGQNFDNCTCITSGHATAGLCLQDCTTNLYIYSAFTFIGKLVSAFSIVPMFIAKLRCVEERDRGVCTALSGFISSTLAWMPAPVIFGALIDGTCTLWKYTCGERQSCKLYDFAFFRNTVHAFAALTTSIGCLGIVGLFIYFRVKGQNVWKEDAVHKQTRDGQNS